MAIAALCRSAPLLAVLAAAGCGATTRTPPTAPATAPPARTTAVPGPTPRVRFHSPQRDGYRFLRAPLVVREDGGDFTLYVHMNRRLPRGAGASVDGAFGGFALRRTTPGSDTCYAEEMDIRRDETVPQEQIAPGDLVTVKLHPRSHGAPLVVRTMVSPVPPGQHEAIDPMNSYLAQIGCAR